MRKQRHMEQSSDSKLFFFNKEYNYFNTYFKPRMVQVKYQLILYSSLVDIHRQKAYPVLRTD